MGLKSDLELSCLEDFDFEAIYYDWRLAQNGMFDLASDTPFSDMYAHEECSFAYGDLELLDSIYREWRDEK